MNVEIAQDERDASTLDCGHFNKQGPDRPSGLDEFDEQPKLEVGDNKSLNRSPSRCGLWERI
jgi:hypothetical protein